MVDISLILLLFYFCIGLIVGSFLNCAIYRTKNGQSFLKGRSFCPKCKHKLSWADLVPLLSFFKLSGKCRYCGKPISVQYPAVEFATAVLFSAAAIKLVPPSADLWQLSLPAMLALVYYWVLIAFLIIIFVYDLKWYIIPDEAVFSILGASAVFHAGNFFYEFFLTGNANFENLANPILSSITAFSFFLAIFLVSSGRWMGFGDVKYSAAMGMMLGFPDILVGLFLSFFLGAIIGLSLIASDKKQFSSEIPFGPFLVSGTMAALFFGRDLIYLYLGI